MKEENKYALCIECGGPVLDRGYTHIPGTIDDGWQVSACDNRECKRYGLLTTVTK